jgi:hypothetical protein
MLDAVKGSSARLSASELMEEKKKPRVGVMDRLFKVQQIQRAYRAMKERVAASRPNEVQKEAQSHGRIER